MNYGKNNQAARRINRMRDYRSIAEQGLSEGDRREYRKRFNRMVARDPEFAHAHGFDKIKQ